MMASCRSSHNVTEAATRHLDMAATLESVQGRRLDTEKVVETLVMKPDTCGNLKVVHRSVVRTVEHVRDTATASREEKVSEAEVSKSESQEVTVKAKPDRSWIVPAVLSLYVAIVIVLILYIAKLFEKWTSRH